MLFAIFSFISFVKSIFLMSEIRGGFETKLLNCSFSRTHFADDGERIEELIVEDNDQISRQRFEGFFFSLCLYF